MTTESTITPSQGSPARGIPVKDEQAFLNDQAQAMRAGVYQLLARLFAREPDQELLDTLAGIGEVDTSEGKIAMGWELLKQASQKAELEATQQEYFDLFIGVGRGELVPFGSWYLTGFLMEKPVAVLRQDLANLGIERQENVAESEDHIAALCDAMALIIQSSDEISLQTQQTFYKDHIEPWASRFFDDVENANNAHFYRGVGFFGNAFFEFESEMLAMQS